MRDDVQIGILVLLVILYLFYTIRFSIVLLRTTVFSSLSKNIHLVLIWLIPFLWIWVLKVILKHIPESGEIRDEGVEREKFGEGEWRKLDF